MFLQVFHKHEIDVLLTQGLETHRKVQTQMEKDIPRMRVFDNEMNRIMNIQSLVELFPALSIRRGRLVTQSVFVIFIENIILLYNQEVYCRQVSSPQIILTPFSASITIEVVDENLEPLDIISGLFEEINDIFLLFLSKKT